MLRDREQEGFALGKSEEIGKIRFLITGDNSNMDIPILVKVTRLGLGLTQTEFGKKYFCTYQKSISNWETGATKPSKSKVKFILGLYEKMLKQKGLYEITKQVKEKI